MVIVVPLSALAAETVPPVRRIAVVNLDEVFKEYERTKASDTKLGAASNSKQVEREHLVSEIKSLRDELVLLNEESRAERQQTIEQKLRELRSFDEQVKESLRKQRDESVKEILKDIEATVTSYAKEHDFDLVLNERAVLYEVEAVDITKDVLEILNGRYAKQGH